VGLPNSIPGCRGSLLTSWARRAEERGFASVAAIDRIAYPTHDPLVALASAAAVTTRIQLLANVVVGPTRNPVQLAKQAATLQAVSGGRFVLGLGVGDRTDDFALARMPFSRRGDTLDRLISELRSAWSGEPPCGTVEPVVAVPVHVPLLVAGHGDHGIRRAVRFSCGWTAGGLGADEVGPLAARLQVAWREAGHEGAATVVALGYFALGADAQAEAERYLSAYYAWYGQGSEEETIVAGLLRDADAVRRAVAAYEDAGVRELVLYPSVPDLAQIDRLSEALSAT